MNIDNSEVVMVECGDLMLAKECLANLRAAHFSGDVSMTLPSNADELERRGFLGYGTPTGESFAKGVALGGFLGIIAGAVLTPLVTPQPVNAVVAIAIMGSIGAMIGGVRNSLRARNSLCGQNNRAVMLRCRGDSADLLRAISVLQNGPCHFVRKT